MPFVIHWYEIMCFTRPARHYKRSNCTGSRMRNNSSGRAQMSYVIRLCKWLMATVCRVTVLSLDRLSGTRKIKTHIFFVSIHYKLCCILIDANWSRKCRPCHIITFTGLENSYCVQCNVSMDSGSLSLLNV